MFDFTHRSMGKQLNSAGASHAASLVASGAISDDKSWSAPSAKAEDDYIAKNGMSELSKFYMGKDESKPADEKGHLAYPYSADFSSVSMRGLRAIISRAGHAGAKSIEEKAQSLYDETKKKLGKDKERAETAVSRIFTRKATERIVRNEVLTKATEAAGYTSNDLLNWLRNELDDVEFPGGCCWKQPFNLVLPEHEKGEVWQAIVAAGDGCYAVNFKLGDAGVEIVGAPQKVVAKDQYVLMDTMMEEADDEVAGRSASDKSKRKLPAGRMYRIFEVTDDAFDDDKQEVSCSFASELPGMQRCGGNDGRGDPSDHERAAGLRAGQVYYEILDHDPESVDHAVLNDAGAVLDEHDEKDHIGVVVKGSARTDHSTRISRARLKLDDHEKGKMRYRQMKTGSRPHLSVGYKHTGFVGKQSLPNGQTGYRFKWKGLEITSCAVPLDGTIGIGRSYKELPQVDSDYNSKSSEKTPETKEKSMTPEEEKKAAEDAVAAKVKDASEKAKREAKVEAETETVAKVKSATVEAGQNERKRFEEICGVRDELIKSRPDQEKAIRSLSDDCLKKEGVGVKDFQWRAMTEILNAKPAPKNTMEAHGYSETEIKEFSLQRCIQNIIAQADGGKRNAHEPDPDTFEGEVCAKIRKAYQDSGTPMSSGGYTRGNGFMVPADTHLARRTFSTHQRNQIAGRMQRDATMQAGIFGQGGAAVATELLLPIVEILRNEMVTNQLGVTSISGLEGNIIIPRQAAAATAYAVPETGALTLSGQVLDQIPLSPKRVGAFSQYSKQFLLQSSLDVENFIRTDLFAVIALIWDEYIIAGQGGQDQPTGILNQNGVLLVNGTGAFTGYSGEAPATSPSWSDIVNFETQINAINARKQGRGWATTSTAKGRLKTLAKLLVGATTVPAVALWEDEDAMMGRMNGYPAVDSQQVPNGQLIFGVWAQNVIHALWGGLDIVVDPYSLSTQGLVKIVMNTWGDVALRHPQEFCISLASAAN